MNTKNRIKALEITRTTASIKLFRELEQVQLLNERYSVLVRESEEIGASIDYSEQALRMLQSPGHSCEVADVIQVQAYLKELNVKQVEIAELMKDVYESLHEHKSAIALLRRQREELDKKRKFVIVSDEVKRSDKQDAEVSELRRSQKI
ncbi:hypothetical protein [Hahella ganghwensis]|uniref:hypothetical protein n=1 Tax=Hahella ganghwensis TaxID=286420 RepID=UPI00037C1648|nr:hypothetical protein [Hahella ganghwensis]